MRFAMTSLFMCTALLMGCDRTDESLAGPAAPPPLLAMEATGTDSIVDFWISGPTKVMNPGMATFTLRDVIANGDYYVRWYVDRCFDGATECQAAVPGPAGWGLDTLKYYVDADLVEFRITAEIVDTAGYTGAYSPSRGTLGPWGFNYFSDPVSFCDGTAPWYPFRGNQPGTSPDVDEYYHRDPCTGNRRWSATPY